ncbi:Gx transporter family protein [Candidatus Latescibacterota bacterium]
MISQKTHIKRLVLISMLAACGLILFVFESLLPLLPWFRPGFGNVATILALLFFGLGDAFKVTLLRIVLGALILARLFTDIFWIALCGGIVSTFVMGFAMRYLRMFGIVGVSVLGAVSHNVVQLVVAYLLFVKMTELFIFLPVFVTTGILTGILTGLVSSMIYEKAEKRLGLESTT